MIEHPRVRKADAARASLKIPAFRRVWLTVAIGSSGLFGVILVGGLYAYQLSHSTVLAAASYTLVLLPAVVVGPLAGRFVDRNDKRMVMRLGIFISIVPLLLLSIANALHLSSVYLVLGCCAVVGCGLPLYTAAWQALVPGLLPPEDLVAAGSLMQVAQQGGEALGPLVVGLVITLAGTSSGFLACLGFYVMALIVTKGMAAGREAAVRADRSTGAGVIDGIRRVARARPLGLWMVFVGLHCCLTMAFVGLLPDFATHVLHAAYYDSAMLTVVGVGAILGAGALAIAPRTVHTGQVAIGSGVMSGLGLVMLGFSTSPALAIIACFIAGAAQSIFMALIFAMIQGNTPADLRGRVASYSNTMTTGSMSVLSTVWGSIQGPLGFRATFVAPGLLFCLIVLVFIARLKLLHDRSGIPQSLPIPAGPAIM